MIVNGCRHGAERKNGVVLKAFCSLNVRSHSVNFQVKYGLVNNTCIHYLNKKFVSDNRHSVPCMILKIS